MKELRTSTKAGGAMSVGAGIMVLMSEFFPETIGALSPDAALVLGSFITLGIGWVVARLSKTPANPGAL